MPMPVMPARWVLSERNQAAETTLRQELGVSAIVAALLVQRGISDPTSADLFLNPSLDHLHDPSLLPDYELARDEILGAKERGDLIFVHGDYDVDGVTSAAIFHRFLTKIGANVETHVPHRMKEGYGIHHSAVEVAKQKGAKLFLTCDCGISAHDRVEAAKEAGMRVVVTDHHTVGHSLPDAHAIVNPHRADSKYPFPELSGAGVVLKLCAGLTRDLGMPVDKFYRGFLDLAVLGTVADVMPLYGENRIIAKFGLERLAETQKVGLQALKEIAGVKLPLRTYAIGFQLGPRINAVGRIDDSGLALKLLLENDYEAAKGIALTIEQFNIDRKDSQQKMIEEAIEMVETQGLAEKYVIAVASADWHAGIVGLVAGRLVERYNRPAFCFIIDEARGLYKGSARSIPAFSVVDAIRAYPDLIEGGGHNMAAGCSFLSSEFENVAALLNEYA
ncbi:MAG: single-stranded-DNA-specific exonuclease RecJ, partial [Chlorobia bacterium]|nr:single-stranded-DNA-specific exonuclease RecJ [Fimbriimonadaceae bacterium]